MELGRAKRDGRAEEARGKSGKRTRKEKRGKRRRTNQPQLPLVPPGTSLLGPCAPQKPQEDGGQRKGECPARGRRPEAQSRRCRTFAVEGRREPTTQRLPRRSLWSKVQCVPCRYPVSASSVGTLQYCSNRHAYECRQPLEFRQR